MGGTWVDQQSRHEASQLFASEVLWVSRFLPEANGDRFSFNPYPQGHTPLRMQRYSRDR
jgi:hypothetical protein